MHEHLSALEARRLFAVAVTFEFGLLKVTGTPGEDNIEIGLGTVYVSDVPTFTFDASKLGSILVEALGGDDRVLLREPVQSADVPATVRGGAGNDALYGGGPVGSVTDGGSGNDALYATDTLIGGDGNDYLEAYFQGSSYIFSTTDDVMDGGNGHDTLNGYAGSDTFYGGTGNDHILTRNRYDGPTSYRSIIDAGSGHDRVYLEQPATVNGGAGDDRIYFLSEPPQSSPLYGIVDGGAGRDWIQVKDSAVLAPGKTFTLRGGDERDSIVGSRGNDLIHGNSGDDVLFGNSGNDRIHGGAGNDTLHGGGGRDSIYGDSGRDVLRSIDQIVDLLDGGTDGIADVFERDDIDVIIG